MKSKIGIITVCAICTVLLSVTVHAEIRNRVAAVVNDEIITLSDVENAAEPYLKRIRESYKGQDMEKVVAETRKNVLNRLIDNLLLEQEVKKSGIVVKDEELMETIKEILGKKTTSMDEFRNILATKGSSFEAYKEEIRDQMIKMRLVRRELKAKITVGDEEIGEYYLKNRNDYEGKEAVRIKQILILLPKDSDTATKEKLRADARNIHERLKSGEIFDLLAVKYSQGPAAEAGGDLGFIERGMVLPEVEKVAFALERDAISDVIESPVGFHIITVIDRRGAGVKPIEYVREEIKSKIEAEKMEKKYEEWIDALRKRSHVAIKLQ